jgi:ferredoxin
LLEVQPDSRLTCQVEVTDDLEGMVVRLPLTQS